MLFYHKKREERGEFNAPFAIDFNAITMQSFDTTHALDNSDLYTAMNIIASDIAKSEFTGGARMAKFMEHPDTNFTTYGWLWSITMQLLLHGNAFAIIRKNNMGAITRLQIVPPHSISIGQNVRTKELTYEFTDCDLNTVETFSSKDILHFRLNSIDGITGRSPLKSLIPEVDMQRAGVGLLKTYFQKGLFGGAILKMNKGMLDNETKKQIKRDFEAINSGTANANSVLVLDSTQEYQTFTVNTDLLKIINNNQFSTNQIAKVFGIPLNRFGQELVNSADQPQNDLYIASTLSNYAIIIGDEMSFKLGVELELDFATLRNDTQAERVTRLMRGSSQGYGKLTTNEVRAYYGLEPIEGGDTIGQIGNTSNSGTPQDGEGNDSGGESSNV